MALEINYQAEPTVAVFHASDAFFRGIRGPIGSGKSVGCCLEIISRAFQQQAHKGVRRSRWAIVRNTYGELKTTTIKTWLDWFGGCTKITYGHPIEGRFRATHPDGSKVDVELVFLALDKAKDVKKLKSLELTGIWWNEASEIPKELIDMGPGRVNRFPSKVHGGPTWSGIIADTNSPDADNWWYQLAEEEKPEGYEFYSQPPALIREEHIEAGQTRFRYVPNPDAENICNHPVGFDYYLKQIPGKDMAWVNVFIMNRYGRSVAGQNVYDGYLAGAGGNHTDRVFDPGLGHIIWSHDFNFTPLSSFVAQEDAQRNTYAVDEIVLQSAVALQSAKEFCARYKDHKNCLVKIYGDASGHAGEKHGHASDFIEIERHLKKEGFRVQMRVPRANTTIKDGQASLRARICDAMGVRRFFVNPTKCRFLDKGLGTLQFKKGSTFQEEDSEFQHITTAARYYTAVEFPINGNTATVVDFPL